MIANPAYEDLLLKVNELEKEIARLKLVEVALKKSEEFSSSLLTHSPTSIIVYNPDTSVRYVNPSFEIITGYTSEEVLGTRVPYPWWIDDPEYGTIEQRAKLGLNGIYRSERRYRKKNGESFYVEINVTPIYHNEELNYSFSTWTDINERKRAEQELRKSSLIIDSTSDSIITTDINGIVISWNHGAEEIFGYKKEEVIGKPVSILYKEEDLHILDKIITTLVNGNDIPGIEITTIDKNRTDVYILLSLTTIKDKYGNIIEFVGITKDITKRREIEEALITAHNDLENRVRARTIDLHKANEDLNEKTKNQEDLNTALRILLENREKDKKQNEDKILLNVKELLIPYLYKLKNSSLTENQRNYIELLESGLQNIISPFAHKLTSMYMHITPGEMKVASLLREGKTSKEIAEILNSTERAIVAHRLNLRKKLNLNRKANLRTYLLSVQ